MGRQMPWDDIPDSNVFPTGIYHVEGVQLEERTTNNGKLMYSVDMKVVEHPATQTFTNMHYFENFVIGSDDDPDAGVPGTWVQSFGAKFLKQMVVAAQVAEKADMDKICASFTGTQFLVGLQEYKEPEKNKDGTANQYAGQPRNRSTGWYKIGAKEPMLEPKKPVPGAAPAAAAPSMPQQPVGGVVAQPQTAPAPAAAPAAAAPAAVAPPVAAAPAAAPPATPAPAGNVQMQQCTVCGQQVEATKFAEHINACLAQQGQAGASIPGQ